MRILYLTQWFDPEPAFKGLAFAKALREQGFDVEVATGFPNYPGGKLHAGYRLRPWKRETMDGLTVHRLFLYPSHDASSPKRALNYLSFFTSVLIFGLVRGWRYDAIYIYHPPITPAFAAALFTRLWRKPYLVEIQDLWPDSVIASGMMPGRAYALLGWMCDFVYRKAARIVAQSAGIRDRLAGRGVATERLSVIYNWSNYLAGDEIPETSNSRSVIDCVYGGNLGQAQALGSVIEAARLAQQEVPAFRLHLYGNGIERGKLEAAAAQVPGNAVTVHGPVPRSDMDRIFEQSDILVLHLNDDPLYAITIPSKLQHYLSCGKPVVAGLSGESAQIVRDAQCGLVSAPMQAEEMASQFVRLCAMTHEERAQMGRNARDFYQANMSFEHAMAETARLISQLKTVRNGETSAS